MEFSRSRQNLALKHTNSLMISSSLKKPISVSVLISFALLGDLPNRIMIPVSPQTLEILSLLLKKHPHVFDSMLHTIHSISEDGKVDSNDASQIMVLIKQTYLLVKNIKYQYGLSQKECAQIASSIVQVVVRILCDENRIHVDDKQTFIKRMDELVDIYLDLAYSFGQDKRPPFWRKWISNCCSK